MANNANCPAKVTQQQQQQRTNKRFLSYSTAIFQGLLYITGPRGVLARCPSPALRKGEWVADSLRETPRKQR